MSDRQVEEVVAISGRSILVRRDGQLECKCAYLCLATYERCEFEELLHPRQGTERQTQ